MSSHVKICPKCAHPFGFDDLVCPEDGLELLEIDDSDDTRVGQTLDGRYTILGVIGVGGMGTVYRALQHSMEREIAVKLLHGSFLADPDVVRRFLLEAKGVSSLSHPNIITLFDFGQSGDGGLYLAMELLDGRALREVLTDEGALSLEKAVPIICQVCDAVHAADAMGVVHRDLKPENIFLVRGAGFGAGFVKVIDFGLAKVRPRGDVSEPVRVDESSGPLAAPPPEAGPRATGYGKVYGTPDYMSPEQARGDQVDGRSDVYAIGVVLYEMLVGETPFSNDEPDEVLRSHILRPPPRPSVKRPDLPESVEEVILAALSKRREDRPQTASLLKERLLEAASSDRASRSPAGSPPPRVRRATNMTPPLTSFIGRSREMEALRSLLGEQRERLITLLGPAGMGKTRLAINYGLTHISDYASAGGVWFCDLSDVTSADGTCHEVARALGVAVVAGSAAEDVGLVVGRALERRGRLLLILDNFEQLVADGPATVGRWSEMAPDAQFLVTSRSRLRLAGEKTYDVLSLSLPRRKGHADTSEAVQLFVERTRAVRPDFALDRSSSTAVAEIVRQLDGMPLSIELAAARMTMVSAPRLLERLRSRFDLLSGGGGADRRSTLRRAIDWSWSLLEPWEKAGLAQLSVFVGGFTLEAAEAVLDLSEFANAPWALDVVQALRDKSLVRSWDAAEFPGEPRFGMYKSIRDYAAEKLTETGGDVDVRSRHATYFLNTCETWAEGATGHEGHRLRKKLAAERGNVIAIHVRALVEPPPSRAGAAQALRAMLVLDPVLSTRGPFKAHVAWLDAAVRASEETGVDQALLTKGYLARGEALRVRMRIGEAESDAQRALEMARAHNDRWLEGRSLFALGMVTHRLGRQDEAGPVFEGALAIHREVGDREAEGRTTGMLGVGLLWIGRLTEGRVYLEAALRCLRETGDRWFEGFISGCLGWLHQELGEFVEARRLYDRTLGILREVNAARYEALFLRYLGCLEWEEGALDAAQSCLERAVRMSNHTGDTFLEAHFLANLAAIDAERGRVNEALAALEIADSTAAEVGTPWLEVTIRLFRGHADLALARATALDGDHESASRHRTSAEGRAMAATAPTPPDQTYPNGRPPHAERSDEVRFALRMLRKALKRSM